MNDGAGPRSLAVAQPADPRREALERDPRLGHRDPAVETGIVGEELEDRLVGTEDVGRVAGQGGPAERPAALAELWPDERRHETGVVEGVRDTGLVCLGAEVVAVVEHDGTRALEGEHRADMRGHRLERAMLVLRGEPLAQFDRVTQRHLRGDVAAQRVVRGGLIGHEVEPFAGGRPCGLDLRGVPDERDGQRVAVRSGLARPGERLRRIVREPVDVADVQPPLRTRRVDLDGEAHPFVHRDRERLRATHPAEPRGEGHRAAQGPAEVLSCRLRERLERALQDPLRADVDPRAGGHLAVHRQPGLLQLAEGLPRRPAADEVGVRDEDPWRPFVRPQHAHGLAGLDEQRLVVAKHPQLADDRVEGIPRPRGTPGAAVDDEVVRVLGDLGVEVVHEHAQGRFLGPAATGQFGAPGGTDGTWTGAGHGGQATPSTRSP